MMMFLLQRLYLLTDRKFQKFRRPAAMGLVLLLLSLLIKVPQAQSLDTAAFEMRPSASGVLISEEAVEATLTTDFSQAMTVPEATSVALSSNNL